MARFHSWLRISQARARLVKLFCGVTCLLVTIMLASRSFETTVRCFPSRIRSVPAGETLLRWSRSRNLKSSCPGDTRSALVELARLSAALDKLPDYEDLDSQSAMEEARAALGRARFHLDPSRGSQKAPGASEAPFRVCPEHYVNSTVGYPFFYDGWRTKDCPLRHSYGKIVSVLLTATSETDITRVHRLAAALKKAHPDIPVLVGIPARLSHSIELSSNMKLLQVKSDPGEGEMLDLLFRAVETEYVLVGVNLDDFSSDGNIERLLREADRQEAGAVAGALRRPNGHWSHGCFQVSAMNYSLGYVQGYRRSEHECLYCDYAAGPFLARTDLLRQVSLHGSSRLWQEHLFLQLPRVDSEGRSRPVLVCPDVMFHVRKPQRDAETSEHWLLMAREMQVLTIRPPEGAVLRFTCQQLGLGCSVNGGEILSPCCRRQLLKLIHRTMALCTDANAICELQEGTLLGALKMSSVLPWERDADIAVSSAHFNQVARRAASSGGRAGLRWHTVSRPYCCFDGRESGGVAWTAGEGWRVELWGQHWMDTEKLRDERQMPPTRVLLDGRWYPAPRNPGLYVRNRYGREVYRHAEHWIATGQKSGWAAYDTGRFLPCPRSGHHGCTDQFLNDGVLQFYRTAIDIPP